MLHNAGNSTWQTRWFCILMGGSLIAHELSWLRVITTFDGLSLWSYYDQYKRLVPVLNVPESLVIVVHMTLFLLAGLLLFSRHREILAFFLLPVLIPLFLFQGTKPSNHLFFLVLLSLVYTIHLLFCFCSSWAHPSPVASCAISRRFLRLNMLIVLCSTYLAAACAKLNGDFLNPMESVAGGFMKNFFAPINRVLQLGDSFDSLYGWVGIATSLMFEVGVPVLLIIPATRRLGFVLGLVFQMMLIGFMAWDFGTACLAAFPFALEDQDFAALHRQTRMLNGCKIALTAAATTWFTTLHLRPDAMAFGHGTWMITLTQIIYTACIAYFTVCAAVWLWSRGKEPFSLKPV